jgi:predicted nucleotidyltransferase
MAASLGAVLDQTVEALRAQLGDNLFSCCLYGSAVRGNLLEGVSDLNLLIVLKVSNCDAHERIAKVIGSSGRIDPFVLGRHGLERSVRAFAAKFSSIKRNYRVLYGEDPLAGIEIGGALERFLCEQAVRNLRLRMAFAFIMREREKGYGRFLVRSVTPIFLRLSEMARLQDAELPVDFGARIPIFEKEFGIDGRVLAELLALKTNRAVIPETAAADWHARVFPLLDLAVLWIERQWPAEFPGDAA